MRYRLYRALFTAATLVTIVYTIGAPGDFTGG